MGPTMAKFLAGFLTASVVWGAAAWAYVEGYFAEPKMVDETPVAAEELEATPEVEAPTKRRRRARRTREPRARTPMGNATTGDDLGEDSPRELTAGESGGEQQLSNAQVESVFDAAFGGIRRCLVLIEGDDEVRGRVTFGLRIAPSGNVERVNLSGPSAVTTGLPAECLQRAARRLRFPSFDGPPMVVRYPITLE